MKLRIGVDTGGTFTDVCMFEEESGRVAVTKLSSTPDDPSRSILNGIASILNQEKASASEVTYFAHGTTVATNALIQHSGARTGLVTTEGFRDLLELGRQRRPDLYDLQADKPVPLVPRDLRVEVKERVTYDGRTESPLTTEAVLETSKQLKAQGVTSVAICFLHSYLNPSHEKLAQQILKRELTDVYVSASHEVLPQFREYERLSTVVINAYLGPVIQEYIRRLEIQLKQLGIESGAYITQSNGGIISLETARRHSVRTVLSGPSAGVVGATYVGTLAGFKNLISFDMGGTSTDVSLIENGQTKMTGETEVQGYPIRVPALEVNTVGAGGGSVAWIDKGGHLKVGPHSMGAVPGPACYGLGNEEPTVTDANVVLRTLHPEYLLGGRMRIDSKTAWDAVGRTAGKMGMDPMDVAQGIISLVTSNMARAIRVISVRKGYDPRDFTLVAFGGAGPLHAARLAKELSIPRVLVPEAPGILCALGLLVTDIRSDYTLTRILEATRTAIPEIRTIFSDLENQACRWLDQEGVAEKDRLLHYSVDMRYQGQNYELSVFFDPEELATGDLIRLVERFHLLHQQNYGYSAKEEPVQMVTFCLAALGRVPKVSLKAHPKEGTDARNALKENRRVFLGEQKDFVDCPVYQRDLLRHGNVIQGPAIVEQMDSTTLVLPGQRASVDSYHNLLIDVFGGNE